jgi:hypothetical protein
MVIFLGGYLSQAMRVFLVIFGQGILSPSKGQIQVRSGLMNLWLLPGQGILRTGKYFRYAPLLNIWYGITKASPIPKNRRSRSNKNCSKWIAASSIREKRHSCAFFM